MSKAVFRSTRGDFHRRNNAFVNLLLSRMSLGIEVGIKTTAGTPVKQGLLKSSTTNQQIAPGKFRVQVNKAYAAYQEAGVRADGSHPVSNYSTSSTSAGWFSRAIGTVIKNRSQYIAEAKNAVGL